MVSRLTLLAFSPLFLAGSAFADYQDIVNFFASIGGQTQFPVSGGTFDDLEGAFGPRIQTTTSLYDWHRGVDIDGALNSDPIIAALPGYFYDYRYSASGGYQVILYHKFSDFNGGAVNSIEYNGQQFTRFYTWYLHLSDDGVNGNGTGSYDQFNAGYVRNDAIAQGTQIGILGNTGAPAGGGTYGPHLHFELRFGFPSSLEFQSDPNNNTTFYGFDPHLNPMFLFTPYPYGQGVDHYQQSLALETPFAPGQDVSVVYTIDNDEMPLLNRFEVLVRDANANLLTSQVLDFNTREGFDATSTAALDTQDASLPYVQPVAFGDDATQFQSKLVLPQSYLDALDEDARTVTIIATDIWGEEEILTFALVPESASAAGLLGLATLGLLAWRRRGA